MDDAVGSLSRGSRVWYRQDAATWLLAEIKDAGGNGAVSVTLLTGQPGTVLEGLQDSAGVLVPANPALQQGIADLTQLSYLNEPSILDNLTQRYEGDNIYTNAGPVLIAVNPCKNLPLYTAEVAREYKAGAFEAVNKLAPHIYLVAGAAFRDMVRQDTSQSLVINGESGAGKTETTKKAMQFFAALAGGTGVEDQVLETNPILESFGNAKTLRNHNSSRFGKLIEIHFNKTNHICGARIRTYLLEKSRVVHQLKGERSFHIFYQLVRGGNKDKALKAALKLPTKPSEFAYLGKSGCVDIDGVDDAADFAEVMTALADIGVQQADLDRLLATLSGILWLGNLKIDPVHSDDSSRVKADAALTNAAQLLGLTEKELSHAITHKKIKTRDELIVKPLTAQEAVDARDALAKALYSGVFDWIVAAINAKLDMGKKGSGRFIAILDIYGFEQFQVNSFEQLCINYANERLQQQFTRHLFTLEQEEYESEGIDWTKVEWVDNQACVDVIEAMPPKGLGVLAVLDSQCRFPRGSDDTFMNSLRDQLAANDHFRVNARRQDEFIIEHYAGPVAYNTAGFLDKNKDMLNTDLVELIQGSGSSMVAQIGDEAAAEMEGKRGGQTVSSRFTGQLKELVAMLDATGLHFVRCIKPNGALVPGQLSLELVLQQLRCCGVLEVARVSRAGYPTRYRHGDFVSRYKILLPSEQQDIVMASEAQLRSAVLQLLGVFKVQEGQYEMGRTKVFFKPGVLGYVEDTWAKMHLSVLKLQAYTRMRQTRQRYQAARAAALLVQSGWRARAVRLTFGRQLREHRAAVRVQTAWRTHSAQAAYARVHAATRTIQAGLRRHKLEQRVAARTAERLARERAEFEAREAVRRREEGFDALKDEYGVKELSEVRAALACYASLRGELDSRDPAEVQDALALLAVVRRTQAQAPGGGSAEALSPPQLRHALVLSAACQALLGPQVDEQQLQDALATASVVQQQLGTVDPGALRGALAAASLCQQQLGTTEPAALQEALATAAACRQALGEGTGQQQVQDSLALAALAQQQLGGEGPDLQQRLQAALASAAACEQHLAQHEGTQLSDTLAAAALCSKEAGSLEAGQLRQRLVMAESARQALGSLDERQLVQSLSAAALCRQLLGEQEQAQLQDALAAAAECREQLGGWDVPLLQQRLQVAAAAEQQFGPGCEVAQLREALAAAALCLRELGSFDEVQLQQRLDAAAAAQRQLGSCEVAEVAQALGAAAVCKEVLGDWDEQKLRQHLAVADAATRELGSCDEAEVQQALATAHLCKDRLGSLDQKQLQRQLSLAEAAHSGLGADADEARVKDALATAALCEGTLGTHDQQALAAALGAAALCKQQLGSWDEGALRAALAAAVTCQQELCGGGGGGPQQQQQQQQLDLQQLQQTLGLAKVVQQQLAGGGGGSGGSGGVDQQQLRAVLHLGQACQAAGVEQPGALAGKLQLAAAAAGAASPDDVTAALALQQVVRSAGGAAASPEQVAAALQLQHAAEEQGIHDAGSLQAALAAAAAAATAAAAAKASSAAATEGSGSGLPAGVERSHVVLGSVVAASDISDPDELQLALSTYRSLRPALQAHRNDPKLARRACSMYAAAVTHGIADKRDFMAAAALYAVLREDGITSAGELRLAVAMYTAVRQEGILDPDDLHMAIGLATAARDEGISDPLELAHVLAASRPGHHMYAHMDAYGGPNGFGGGGPQQQHLGSLRATGGVEAAQGSSAAGLQAQVLSLQGQLEAEKAARSKYARQLEQQAVEWMGQVRLLKEYIDSLRAKMPQASAASIPNIKMPAGLAGGGGDGAQQQQQQQQRRASDPAAGMLAGLESDWTSKAPLFDDDAEFIREVVDGEVLAPDMQVQMELDRLRQKYEAWSKQFKQRMREAQTALRRKQGAGAPTGPGGVPLAADSEGLQQQPYSSNSMVGREGSPTGVAGVVHMVGNAAPAGVATYAAAPGGRQQQQPQQQLYQQQQQPSPVEASARAMVSSPQGAGGGKASGTVDVRKMPNLMDPDLLGGSDRGSSDGGGRKKKGGMFSRVFG